MSKSTPAHDEAGRRMRRVLCGLADQARGDLARIRSCPAGGIHALRRRMKKMQSVLQLVRDHVPPRTMQSIRRRVKSLKDAFAPQRDREVMVRVAEDIGGRRLAARIEARIPARRASAGAKLAKEAKDLASRVRSLRLDTLTWDEVAKSCERGAKRARKAWRAAVKEPTPENLHRWRKRTKTLYFQMLLLHPAKGKMVKQLDRAERLGHWLGRMRDLHLLAERLGKQRSKGDARWNSKIGKRMAKLRTRAFRAGKELHRKPKSKSSRKLVARFANAGRA